MECGEPDVPLVPRPFLLQAKTEVSAITDVCVLQTNTMIVTLWQVSDGRGD